LTIWLFIPRQRDRKYILEKTHLNLSKVLPCFGKNLNLSKVVFSF